MASCHSLSFINGQLTGDPLDSNMFNFTNWTFLDQSTDNESKHDGALCIVVPPLPFDQSQLSRLHVMKSYPFQSSLQRMSVLVKEDSSDDFIVFTKGSPEMILSMCTSESKPNDILKILEQYAKDGYRLLAISIKRLSSNCDLEHITKISRSDVECDLSFLGFIIFENALKPTSNTIIKTLQRSNIRVAMATGDNLYTAVAVAREVGIIEPHQKTVKFELKDGQAMSEILKPPQGELQTKAHGVHYPWSSLALDYTFVLTGNTYIYIKENHPELHRKVLVAGSVFARMSPDQKTVVINDLKEIGYGVAMWW